MTTLHKNQHKEDTGSLVCGEKEDTPVPHMPIWVHIIMIIGFQIIKLGYCGISVFQIVLIVELNNYWELNVFLRCSQFNLYLNETDMTYFDKEQLCTWSRDSFCRGKDVFLWGAFLDQSLRLWIMMFWHCSVTIQLILMHDFKLHGECNLSSRCDI